MMEALQQRSKSKRRVASVMNFSAPVGGWVSDSDFMSENPNTARIMKNFVPRQNDAYVRGGSATVSVLPAAVESLYEFNAGDVKQLIAAAGDKLYHVVNAFPGAYTPIPTPIASAPSVEIGTGFTGAKWSAVMMSNAADVAKLVMVNGVDGLWVWDGTTLEEGAISSANLTLNSVISFKARLWFTKVNDATLYYGDPLSNGPATLTEFPMGPYLRLGGSIIAINSLSMDGGSGPDDFLVAVSTNGEVIVFSGIDPADDFQIVGVFKGARPLSARCLRKAGSDLIYYGSSGPQKMTDLFKTEEGIEGAPIPIRTEFEAAMRDKAPQFGWDLILYSARSWLLFNVVINSPKKIVQYVLNMESNAWFQIEGWSGISWCVHSEELYFGTSDGKVVKADYGTSDDGLAVNFDYMQSWNQFKTPEVKKFNQVQVTIKSNSVPKIAIDMNVNYREVVPTSEPGFAPDVLRSPWNTSPWNTSPWGGADVYYVNTFGVGNIGFVGALRYRGQVLNSSHYLMGFRVLYEPGESI